jgi:Tetratricopeptide repeat
MNTLRRQKRRVGMLVAVIASALIVTASSPSVFAGQKRKSSSKTHRKVGKSPKRSTTPSRRSGPSKSRSTKPRSSRTSTRKSSQRHRSSTPRRSTKKATTKPTHSGNRSRTSGPRATTPPTQRQHGAAQNRSTTQSTRRVAPQRRATPQPSRTRTPNATRSRNSRATRAPHGATNAARTTPHSGSTRRATTARSQPHRVTPVAPHGTNTAIDLQFRGGKLRGGSISVNPGHGGVTLSAYGRGSSRYGSAYGRPHGGYGSRFYGPHRSYWSTAYYPDYASVYSAGYGYVAPVYGYSFGSVYWRSPRVVTVYQETPSVVDTVVVGQAQMVTPSEVIYDNGYATGSQEYQPRMGVGNNAPPIVPSYAADENAFGDTQGWGPILGEGNVAFAQGRYVDARRVYVRAMLIDERDGYAKMLFAWTNFALGDYQLAATALRSALLTSPDLVQYPIDIRMHYEDLAMLDQQADVLRSYVATNPGDHEAALLLGYLYYSIGDLPRGLISFSELAAANPDDQSVFELRDAAARATRVGSQGY